MNKVSDLEKQFIQELDLANLMKTANHFEEMRNHYFNALKLSDFFAEYNQETKKKQEWQKLAITIASNIKSEFQVKPIEDSKMYQCSSYSVFTISGGGKCGTCFLVDAQDNNYYFVTNRHVISEADTFKIQDKDEKVLYYAEVVNKSNVYDIAIVKAKITKPKHPLVPVLFANPEGLIEGMKIYIIGNRSGLGLGFITGHVASFRDENILLNVTTEHGTSGSAIFDEYGSVIGINCGNIAEVPFAIHSKILLDYLKTNGLKIKYQRNVKY